MEKGIIRKKLISQRNTIPFEDRQKKSQLIRDRLTQNPDFSTALTIMAYVSFASEVITQEIITHSLREKKRVIVPVVDIARHHLLLSEIKHHNELVPSTYGIMEPQQLRIVQLDQIELFILPGVAFDEKGVRLGYGGGYFDRLLGDRKQHQKLIGLAFELQMQKELPCLPHDIFMNMVITEEKVRAFGSEP
jgi:5-formyltetrahydrofolate cyclo-ligase